MEHVTAEVTAFGKTRTVELSVFGARADSRDKVAVGRFPTGSKIHASRLTLWKREQPTGPALRGATAAVIDGDEYVVDPTLYTHNRNVGLLFGWNEDIPEAAIAKWTS